MNETLKMMKSILTGKEKERDEVCLIKEYQEKMSPNILAYFYVNNFGLISKVSNLYPKLDTADKASFCLQELDSCLQTFDEVQNISFIKYFITFYKYRLSNEQKKLQWNKRKSISNYLSLDTYINISKDDSIEDIDLILDSYKLDLEEKKQCKLLYAGYTIREISKLLKLSENHTYYNNSKIKQKILKLI